MADYIKLNNSWVEVYKIYKKVNGEWVEQTDVSSAITAGNIYICNSVQIDETIYVISGVETYTGKTFNLQAILNNRIVPATWTITSGSQYATINQNGKVSIVEGTTNQSITVQAVYNGHTETKTITISYDNQLVIEGLDTITGISGNVIARYNSSVVYPSWSIISGNNYATISNSGDITIIDSGTIVVQADFNNYTSTKTITLVYDSHTETETSVDENGNVTTQTVTSITNSETGITTTTSTSTTVNDDGSSSTSESTATTSAPDPETGAITTEATVTVINSDGTSSELELTIIENQDGSSSSSSTRTNYDENGDVSGSTENDTINNADGSSSSTTTNYDENGDPTDKVNEDIDVSGNEKTQDIEFTYNETTGEYDEVVVGYEVDTTNNSTTGNLDFGGTSEDAINTNFQPFNFDLTTEGFEMVIYFRARLSEQPTNEVTTQWTFLDMTPDDDNNNNKWTYNQGIVLRMESGKDSLAWQLRTSNGNNNGKGKNISSTTINGVPGYYKVGLRYYGNKLVFRNLLTNTNILSLTKSPMFQQNPNYPDRLKNTHVTIGSAWNSKTNTQFRYSVMDLYEFKLNKITEWTDY